MPPLDTDFAATLKKLRDPRAKKDAAFPIATRMNVQRAKDIMKSRARAVRRSLIKPENCRAILENLPLREGDSLHAITPGDFVFCDLIAAFSRAHNGIRAQISTLSMSVKNADSLRGLLEDGHLASLDLIVSHYFRATSKEVFAKISALIASAKRARIGIARSHCKITLLETRDLALVIEGSANLRSSDSFEQISAFANRSLLEFHAVWFDQMFARGAE